MFDSMETCLTTGVKDRFRWRPWRWLVHSRLWEDTWRRWGWCLRLQGSSRLFHMLPPVERDVRNVIITKMVRCDTHRHERCWEDRCARPYSCRGVHLLSSDPCWDVVRDLHACWGGQNPSGLGVRWAPTVVVPVRNVKIRPPAY